MLILNLLSNIILYKNYRRLSIGLSKKLAYQKCNFNKIIRFHSKFTNRIRLPCVKGAVLA